MLKNSTQHFRDLLIAAGVAILLAGSGAVTRLTAQGTTATILGTVTDATGGTIPGAAVQVKNVGTSQIQSTQTDAAGRFNVPDLGVGNYEVQASKDGFSTVVHKGITLTVGSQNVVDFSLPVGQTQQTVTVEGAVTQVETTNAAVSQLVDTKQMRDLPLNGRNFESLILTAPGVQNYYASSVAATGLNVREGKDPAVSVAGSRPEGIALLLDDQSLETFYNRGIGSITGTSLGVESIGEFQTVTNTYGAQFGGNGAVMNAVTRSGTNDFHGSLYEFLRNSDLDARNFFDPHNIPEFRRNQYGGTIGGPLKKDKLFFFFNYEGIRFIQGFAQLATVPLARASTSTNPATRDAINALLALYPQPTFGINKAAGTGLATVVENQTAHENYYLGRFDYNLSDKDSIFGRYFMDRQDAVYPFAGSAVGLWPEDDSGTNQFFNMEERHIFSPNVINVARGSFSRTNVFGATGATHPGLQLYPGQGRPDATIQVGGGVTAIGTGIASPQPAGQVQNRYSEGDDLAWTRGPHTMRFGASIDRVQSATLWPFQSQSVWTFANVPTLLAGTAVSLSGVSPVLANYPVRDFRELDFVFYGQDDWKVTPKLTLNLGLRYEPATNPIERRNNLYNITNFRTDTAFTNVPHVMITNPSWKNYDPRVGLAYDPFANHKTSIRAGFGMFHEVLFPGIWAIGFINSPPWNLQSQTSGQGQNSLFFQNPSISGGGAPFTLGQTVIVPSITTGYAYQLNRTPYMMQYNLNIQREIFGATVLSVGYVGSKGVNLITGSEQNPVPYSIDSNGVYHFVRNTVGSQRTNPALGGFSLGVNGTNSRYDSLQASLNRRFARNVEAQVSYTYSKCLGTGDATLGSLAGNTPTLYSNPYNWRADYSVCGYNITQALRANSLVTLPFHGNRLVEGWQFSGILSASTGLPFNVTNGAANGAVADQSNQINGTSRPDYAPNNPAITVGNVSFPACNNHPLVGTVGMWFNPNCFSQEAFGTLGNLGREAFYGPSLVNLDIALLKNTKIRENINLQFRAEVFNILNHTNLSVPGSAQTNIFQGNPSPTTTLGRNSTAGQIQNTAAPSREIQLGLKLIF